MWMQQKSFFSKNKRLDMEKATFTNTIQRHAPRPVYLNP